jgi:hypothetical protein
MRTAEEPFGMSGARMAAEQIVDPSSNPSPVATTRVQNDVPDNPLRALTDPHGSAIFWLGLAGLLGLVLVTGQFKVQAAVATRAGRGRKR